MVFLKECMKMLLVSKNDFILIKIKNMSLFLSVKNTILYQLNQLYDLIKKDNVCIKMLSIKILYEYFNKKLPVFDDLTLQCLNLARIKYNYINCLEINDIMRQFTNIFTIYDYILLYENEYTKYTLENLDKMINKYPELVNEDQHQMAILFIFFSFNKFLNNEYKYNKISNLLDSTQFTLYDIEKSKCFFINIKDKIDMESKIESAVESLVREMTIIYLDKFQPIHVKKYGKNVDYYNTNSLLEMLDVKEQIVKISDFLSNQDEFNHAFYKITIKWIIAVVDKYKLENEILFLAVQIFNRYIFLTSNIKINDCQTIAISCLYLACKNEGFDDFSKENFATIIAVDFNPLNIIKMENNILVALKYDINIPTVYNYICLYSNRDDKIISDAKNLLSNSFFNNYLPSQFASIVIYKRLGEWTDDMIKLTGYDF